MNARRTLPLALLGAALLVICTSSHESAAGNPIGSSLPPALGPVGPVGVDGNLTCSEVPPSRTLVVGDLSKIIGGVPAWEATFASPVPAGSPAHLYYGANDAHCPWMWTTDFQVNAGTVGKADNPANPASSFDLGFRVGDRRRTGQYSLTQDASILESQLLDTSELAACNGPKHAFNGTQFPTAQGCLDATAKDVCGRLLEREVISWKKSGAASFSVVTSSIGGYLWDGAHCARSPSFGFKMVDPSYNVQTTGAVDHFEKLPVPAGRTDTYRVSAGIFLYTKQMTIQDGSAIEHGQMAPGALFLTEPNQFPPSTNPLLEQVPVEAVVIPH